LRKIIDFSLNVQGFRAKILRTKDIFARLISKTGKNCNKQGRFCLKPVEKIRKAVEFQLLEHFHTRLCVIAYAHSVGFRFLPSPFTPLAKLFRSNNYGEDENHFNTSHYAS